MNPNDPAFPAEWTEPDKAGSTHMIWAKGLTKREYFAIYAPKPSTADYVNCFRNDATARIPYPTFEEYAARRCKEFADALIAELSK